jgi:beta-1,4-mannooligosaccharide/beta-1,4-mannosyl-N-acetylglucosamine phosphorylase
VVEDDGEVKVYYGGADTVQCVATTTLDELLNACKSR